MIFNKYYKTFNNNLVHSDIEKKHSHIRSSKLSSLIYGGIDGIFTSFSLLMASLGIHLNNKIFLILNFSNIIGGAISMACGDFLSSYAEYELIKKEYEREKKEIEKYPEEEVEEMVNIYINKYDIPEDSSRAILNNMFNFKTLFLDHMFNFELGLSPPEPNDFVNIIWCSSITFFSFIIFGSVPLISILITNSISISIYFTFISVFILGIFKGLIIKENYVNSGIKLLLVSSLCGGFSYYGAEFFQRLIKYHI